LEILIDAKKVFNMIRRGCPFNSVECKGCKKWQWCPRIKRMKKAPVKQKVTSDNKLKGGSAKNATPKCPKCKSSRNVIRVYADGEGAYKCEACAWHFDHFAHA
jgi:hypothetical protein